MAKKEPGSSIAEKAAALKNRQDDFKQPSEEKKSGTASSAASSAPKKKEAAAREGFQIKWGLSGFTLKVIAIVTMLMDHIGVAVLEPLLKSGKIPEQAVMPVMSAYMILRLIGRLAFPIFCFLLVEGFFHSKNRWKYVERLGLFALISELPFDLAFYQKIVENSHQNVFFTLVIGLLTLMGLEAFEKKLLPVIQRGRKLYAIVGQLFILCIGFLSAVFLRTDYNGFGVLLIAVFYLFHASKTYRTLIGALLFITQSSLESAAVVSFLPIWFYNGKRGKNMKYFFYVFYPAHLLLLAFVGQYLVEIAAA